MNESRRMGGPIDDGMPNAVGPGRITYDTEPQTDMLVDDEQITSDYRYAEGEERAAPQPVQDRGTYLPRTVVIEPMHHGYVVKLDCHKFAFESADRALKYVTEYLKDPQGTEEKWWKKELFK
jgi:hypothetical protein